jgi:hypothetical protein
MKIILTISIIILGFFYTQAQTEGEWVVPEEEAAVLSPFEFTQMTQKQEKSFICLIVNHVMVIREKEIILLYNRRPEILLQIKFNITLMVQYI